MLYKDFWYILDNDQGMESDYCNRERYSILNGHDNIICTDSSFFKLNRICLKHNECFLKDDTEGNSKLLKSY